MKTVRIKVYKFSELSKDAKEKAVNKLYDINVNYSWWDSMYEDANNIGLKITGFDLDRRRGATGEFLLSACEVAENIIKDHGEGCTTYKTALSFMEVWQTIFNEYMDETNVNYESREHENTLIELETNFLNELLEDYSILLQKESEYLQSEVAIIETIEANDYDFTADGKLF